METVSNPVAHKRETRSGAGPCGVLAEIDDERLRLMSLLVRTYRRLADLCGRELRRAAGIPPIYFDVLIAVDAVPGGRPTMSRLSADVALTSGGLTRLVDRMVEAGLVARENSVSDRRSIHVLLTPAGHEVFERAVAAHVESIDRHLVAPLNEDERAALTLALIKIRCSGR
jgi:DNA-binding MarR family transcriptional regulator